MRYWNGQCKFLCMYHHVWNKWLTFAHRCWSTGRSCQSRFSWWHLLQFECLLGFIPWSVSKFWFFSSRCTGIRQCEHHATTSHTCNFSCMTLKAGAVSWSKQRDQDRDKSYTDQDMTEGRTGSVWAFWVWRAAGRSCVLCVFNCEVLQWQAVTTKLSWVLQKFVSSSVPFDPWGSLFVMASCTYNQAQEWLSYWPEAICFQNFLFPESVSFKRIIMLGSSS